MNVEEDQDVSSFVLRSLKGVAFYGHFHNSYKSRSKDL